MNFSAEQANALLVEVRNEADLRVLINLICPRFDGHLLT